MTLEIKPKDFGQAHIEITDELLMTDPDKQADYLGNKLGCPSVLSIKEKRSPDVAARTYGEVLFDYGLAIQEIERSDNPLKIEIIKQIESGQERHPNEPLAVYDQEWIKDKDTSKMPGPETIWGYALARMIRSCATKETLPRNVQQIYTPTDKKYGLIASLIALELALKDERVTDANSLLVVFAENLFDRFDNPTVILQRMLSLGKLKQDTDIWRTKHLLAEFQRLSPRTFKYYRKMTHEQRINAGITSFE